MRAMILCVASLMLVLGLFVLVERPASREKKPPGSTDESKVIREQVRPIGWVFGRLVGVPGADRPLMSSFGPAQPAVQPPSNQGSHP